MKQERSERPTREEVIRVARECGSAAAFAPDHFPNLMGVFERLALHFYEAGAAAAREPFGTVTVRRLSQRFENHVDQYQFYPAGQSPYLDNADECVTVYTRPQPQEKK